LAFIAAVGQAGRDDALSTLLPLLDETGPQAETIRLAALAALEHFSSAAVAAEVLARYAGFSPSLRGRAVALLCSRGSWSRRLVGAVEAGKIDAGDVPVDRIRQMLAHDDQDLARAIEARWGKIRPATPGAKQAYVPVLGRLLNEGAGEMANGQKLFVKHCANCHTLFGEGAKVGPDLTSADRKNRDALLINILDPSGTIRPEYVSQTALLTDGRVLTGLVSESGSGQLTFVDAKNQKITVARDEIEEIRPAEQSLMPERLLETLTPQELRDLFRYLQSDAPAAAVGGQ
jgi:putative heme-binding domain-containing protein